MKCFNFPKHVGQIGKKNSTEKPSKLLVDNPFAPEECSNSNYQPNIEEFQLLAPAWSFQENFLWHSPYSTYFLLVICINALSFPDGELLEQ